MFWGSKLDILGFYPCSSAGIEICYNMSKYADYFIGSEFLSYGSIPPGPAEGIYWQFDEIIPFMETSNNPEAVARFVVDNSLAVIDLKPYLSHTWCVIDLSQIGYLKTSNIIWSDSLLVKLEDGLAKVKFKDPEFERVRISVEWIEGKTQLKSVEVQLYVGYRVSQIIGHLQPF